MTIDWRSLMPDESVSDTPRPFRLPAFPVRTVRFVTTLTNDYTPGLMALLQSLKENAEIEFAFTVLAYHDIFPRNLGDLAALDVPLEFVPIACLGKFPAPETIQPRLRPNFNKLLVWLLPHDEPCVYIDSDVLCLAPLCGIEAWDTLTVVTDRSGRKPAYEWHGRPHFNAGIFGFRPSRAIYEGLCGKARSYTAPLQLGDQVIHNDYFNGSHPELIRYVGREWNMSALRQRRGMERVRLLHFAHPPKPWRDPCPSISPS